MEINISPETQAVLMMLLKQLGFFGAGVFGLLILWMFWNRLTVNGKIYCYFLENDNQIRGELIKCRPSAKDAVPIINSKWDNSEYILDVNLQRQVRYPAGMPMILQERIPAQCYVRGCKDAIDWRDVNGHVDGSSAILKHVRNVAALGEVSERLDDEFGANRLKSIQLMMMIGFLVIGLASLATAYFAYRSYEATKAIQIALGT